MVALRPKHNFLYNNPEILYLLPSNMFTQIIFTCENATIPSVKRIKPLQKAKLVDCPERWTINIWFTVYRSTRTQLLRGYRGSGWKKGLYIYRYAAYYQEVVNRPKWGKGLFHKNPFADDGIGHGESMPPLNNHCFIPAALRGRQESRNAIGPYAERKDRSSWTGGWA